MAKLVALILVLSSPLKSVAVCGGGAVSTLRLPTVTFVRAYRAAFHSPTRIAADASGNVYVTDPVKGEVVVRAPNGRVISRANGLGYPVSIAVDGAGRIYVGDGASGSVTAFTAAWQKLFVLGQGGGEFLLPTDIAIDPVTGELFVADSKSHLVKVYAPSGAFVRSFGGQGTGDGQFTFPAGIFVDARAREVLVVDQLNFRIQIFDLSGNFLFCFGTQGSGAGKFNVPQGVWADGQGLIYVTDGFEGRIQVLDRNGDFVGFIGDFGEDPGRFRVPTDMVVDSSNRLFVTSANNARVEVFGLGTFTDPESVVPAEVDIQPDPLDRARPEAVVVGYVEVPGYALNQVVTSTITANGVAANSASTLIGDRNGDGVAGLRVEFDWAAFVATLPREGQAAITITGTIGDKQFEGIVVIQITTTSVCAAVPPPVCLLGGADPQCNEAVCIEAVGCTVRPKVDTPCDDGNACTTGDTCSSGVCTGGGPVDCDDGGLCTDDSCDPATGCVHVNNTAPCDDSSACTTGDTCRDGACVGGPPPTCDDGNVCTDDACDPATGCTAANNDASCNDASACTIGDVCRNGACTAGVPLDCDDSNVCTDDSCNPASGCVHSNNVVACDDADPGTVGDACDGTGQCVGRTLTGNYAVLRWPPMPLAAAPLRLDSRVRIRGTICADRIDAGPYSRIDGDATAPESADGAITFGRANRVGGNIVTGGGSIRGLENVSVGGRVDTSGMAPELADCFAASYRASTRWNDFAALATSFGSASPGSDLGSIEVEGWTSLRIPSAGTFGAGQIVVDAANIRLNSLATLTLAGGPTTEQVIVRVHNPIGGMIIGAAARIDTDGLAPEQVIFVVDGPVRLGPFARLGGTVFATEPIRLGLASAVSGALVGSKDIQLDPYVVVDPHPFVGW